MNKTGEDKGACNSLINGLINENPEDEKQWGMCGNYEHDPVDKKDSKEVF